MLGLVQDRSLAATMNMVVLGAANLVAELLASRLAAICCILSVDAAWHKWSMGERTGLNSTGGLVAGTGQALLGLVKGTLGGVWGL